MTEQRKYIVSVKASEEDMRLDRWFEQNYPELSYGHLQKLLRKGNIRLDGKRISANTRLKPGQEIRIPPNLDSEKPSQTYQKKTPTPAVSVKAAQDLKDRVLYRDDWVIALDKPAGLAVQGGSKQTLHLDAMLDILRFGSNERPRLVHRLDRDTSGVLLLARTRQAAQALTASFKNDEPKKIYWALVAGNPVREHGEVDLPLAKRQGAGGEKVIVDKFGKPAKSIYAKIASKKRGISWFALRPLTGRTHQLRVHMAALGFPILGDGKYGGQKAFLKDISIGKSLYLHAREISLPHPEDGTTLRITAALPDDWQVLMGALNFSKDMTKADDITDQLENAVK